MYLDREQTSEPATVTGLRQEIKLLKDRLVECGVDVPPFESSVVEWFGGK